jgi:hypothetical protein
MVLPSLLFYADRCLATGVVVLQPHFAAKLGEGGLTMSETPHISREDLETKFRALQTDIQGRASDKKQSIVAIGGVVATVVVLLAYVFGRRSGRKRGSRVEFRRF